MALQHYSLNGLRIFEAAARHLNFTAAAAEMNVTQAAVSQQIRRLEEQLGVQLFIRGKGRLSLSVLGQELANSASVALGTIQRSIDRITNSDSSGVLTVSTLASFASKWLVPRLGKFQQLHPDIALHVHTSGNKVDFIRDGIDAAIRLSATETPGMASDFLVQESLCLVATPSISRKIGDRLENLYRHPLLLDSSQHLGSTLNDLTGTATVEAIRAMALDRSKLDIVTYDQSDNVVLAALAGRGVALTRLSLCTDDIETGKLELVCNFVRPLTFGYWLVCPKPRVNDPKMVAFNNWMKTEITVG